VRLYEFAPQPNRAVLKITQQAHPASTLTPFSPNTAPTPQTTEPIRAYPRSWQHEWIQKMLAAEITKKAQTVKPTEDDLTIANMRYT
jgi:hypothetical protein